MTSDCRSGCDMKSENPQKTRKREPFGYKTPRDGSHASCRYTTRGSSPSAKAPSDTRFPLAGRSRGPASRPAMTLDFSSAAWCGDSLALLVLPTLEFRGPFLDNFFLACPVCSSASHPVTQQVKLCSPRRMRYTGLRFVDGSPGLHGSYFFAALGPLRLCVLLSS